MTAATTVDALVLDTVAYRDKDLVVRFLTPCQGLVSAMAFGARQSRGRFPSGLDRLTRVDAQITSRARGMAVCNSATTREVFWHLRTDLYCSAVASLLCDILLKVHLDPEEAPALFAFCIDSLTTLEGGDMEATPSVGLFLALGILRRLGFLPEQMRCPSCTPGKVAKSYRLRSDSGAIWCLEHDRSGPHRTPLSAAELGLMQQAVQAPDLPTFAAGNTLTTRASMTLLENLLPWFERVLGGTLKSAAFLRSLYAQ
jgi:DNA repair protein RecO (recombination protein O)